MKYLCIQSIGEADIEYMTMFGLSESHEDADKIGQFGSGFVNGILACLRAGITPVVYIGADRVTFHVEGDNDAVFFRYKRKKYSFNAVLRYGEINWTEPQMGLREFISNAIDASGWHQDETVQARNGMKGEPGTTRVFLPYAPFAEYYRHLGKYFLHAERMEAAKVLYKSSPGPLRVYRKGVFVREMEDQISLFDYNLGEESEIDECRNMSDWTARYYSLRALRSCGDPAVIRRVIDAVLENKICFEVNRMECSSYHSWHDQWEAEWNANYGDMYCCNPLTIKYARRKVQGVLAIESCDWRSVFVEKFHAKDGSAVLNGIEEDGAEVLDPTPAVISLRDEVWGRLKQLKFTNGKDKPDVKLYRKLDEAGTSIEGYYTDGTVFIREDNQANPYVMLHEVAHHVTGAGDDTHDFTSFAYRVASAALWGVQT